MIDERIAKFATRKSGSVGYRETGVGRALVFLHGIGSSSASWLNQFEMLKGYRLIAWDAPGYGDSDFLKNEQPKAGDYADALHAFLEPASQGRDDRRQFPWLPDGGRVRGGAPDACAA
jgi:pimeloyl-ACP methyl ester carboxylesterase